ncbi:hypothetical protein HanHA300_Chr12g0432541 [Helianthus annuus]|nr:hypothetical protein HanHA300_Chr12g0432541 [Helianthus annuus]KAJ0504246.1 hypothetical protein HanHA89_Chr12g0457181 [Helianthus annuus]KAJ0673953.1 hypothetical protein HanLR1_Chr12g0434651 [Helianthus annuus]
MVVEFGDNQYSTIIISPSVFFQQQMRRTPASMPAVNRRPHPPHLLPPRTTLTRTRMVSKERESDEGEREIGKRKRAAEIGGGTAATAAVMVVDDDDEDDSRETRMVMTDKAVVV